VDTEEGSNNMMYLPLDRLGSSAPTTSGSRTSSSSSTSGLTSDFDINQLTDQVIEQIRERQNSNTTTSIRREGR